MIDIDKLTVGELKQIKRLAGCVKPQEKLPFGPGDSILIRTVTMIQLGRVRSIGRDFIVLEEGGWVADTARFSETLATGKLNEYERAPSWILVGRGAIVDIYPWTHPIPAETK